MHRLALFYYILILSLVVSCSRSSKPEMPEGDTIYPLEDTRVVDDLSDFVSEISILFIQDDTVGLSGTKKILVGGDRYVFLSGGSVFAVDKQGSILGQYGNVGRGPGEYLNINDICFDQTYRAICCLTNDNAILQYSTINRDFRGRIETRLQPLSASAIIPMNTNRYGLYVSNPVGEESGKLNDFNCLKIVDSKGRIRDQILPRLDFNLKAGFISLTSQQADSSYYLAPESSSSPAVLFRNGEVEEEVFFDFGEKTVPFKYALRGPSQDPWKNVGDIFDADYYKMISSIYTVGSYFYFSAYGKDSEIWNFLLPDSKEKGVRWKSTGLLSPAMVALAVEEDSLIFLYEDYGYTEEIDEKDPIKKLVLQKYGLPKQKDNLVLVKVRFNE